jgi:hypothetical protein
MPVPDYFLPRPAATPDVEAFERLWAEQVEPGSGAAIDYRLSEPRWQFLCWLADTKDVVLHGSGHASIEEFEPRKADDVSEFGARTAVFAASDGLWPMYFALVDRGRVTSLVNACAHVVDPSGGRSGDYYYFSIDRDALAENPWHAGTVYVLPRQTFDAEPEEEWHGLRLASTQWASPVPVRPLARIAVRPEDFPFLDRVNGHDPETVVARATADPDGFPWRD